MGIQADMERFAEDRLFYRVICLQLKKTGDGSLPSEKGDREPSPVSFWVI